MSAEVDYIIRPAAAGTYTAYGHFPGGWNIYDTVDPGYPINHDENISYVSIGSGGSASLVSFGSDNAFPQSSLITKVEVVARRYLTSGTPPTATWRSMIRYSTTDYYSSTYSITGSYADYSYDFISARTWADSDLRDASFEWGIEHKFNGESNNCTSLYVVVGYIPSDVFISGFREIFSRKLRRSRTPEETYTAAVPLEFLATEILDTLSISHEALPRAATMLENIEAHQLMEDWTRQYALCVGQRVNLNDLTMAIDWENQEPTHAAIWSTDVLPGAVADTLDGLAQFDMGSLHAFARAQVAHIQQKDERIATVEAGLPKMNHLGYLADESRTNLVKNSNFQDGFDSIYTQTLNSGTIENDTSVLFFSNEVSFPQSCHIVMGTDVTYQTQGSMSVTSTDEFRTVAIYHKDGAGAQVMSWRLQRASDSYYWDDTDEAWEVASVWNTLSNSTEITRDVSNPIICDVSTTWTLDFGVATGLQNDEVWVGQVDCTEGPYVVAPIITDDSATVTMPEDDRTIVLDATGDAAVRQQWPAARGTVRMTLEIENATARMQDGDYLTLMYGQVGSSGNDFDAMVLRKEAATNPQLLFGRKRNGVAAVIAVKEVDLDRGDVVEVAARWTGAGELELEDYTLSVFVDGVKGTDTTSASHSTTEKYTEIHVGQAATALGYLRAMNYVRNWEVIPRALADEEMLARR